MISYFVFVVMSWSLCVWSFSEFFLMNDFAQFWQAKFKLCNKFFKKNFTRQLCHLCQICKSRTIMRHYYKDRMVHCWYVYLLIVKKTYKVFMRALILFHPSRFSHFPQSGVLKSALFVGCISIGSCSSGGVWNGFTKVVFGKWVVIGLKVHFWDTITWVNKLNKLHDFFENIIGKGGLYNQKCLSVLLECLLALCLYKFSPVLVTCPNKLYLKVWSECCLSVSL